MPPLHRDFRAVSIFDGATLVSAVCGVAILGMNVVAVLQRRRTNRLNKKKLEEERRNEG